MSEHPDDYPELAVFGWSDPKVLEDVYKPKEESLDLETKLLVICSTVAGSIMGILTHLSGSPIHF